MSIENNGNVGLIKPTSSSNEDLSEYTDADESISAPTEFLAEFLSAVMLKDYLTALKYCKLILQYEPNNSTAKEFYPLILEKLHQTESPLEGVSSNDSDEDEGSEETSDSSSNSDSTNSSDDSSDEQEGEDEKDDVELDHSGYKPSKCSDGDATTGSYSSLEDDEADTDQLAELAAKYQMDNVNLGNGNKIYATNLEFHRLHGSTKMPITSDCKKTPIVSGNPLSFGISSDSESPTEPVSQQTIQLLRAKVVPTKYNNLNFSNIK